MHSEGYGSWFVSLCQLANLSSRTSQRKTRNTHELSGKRVFSETVVIPLHSALLGLPIFSAHYLRSKKLVS